MKQILILLLLLAMQQISGQNNNWIEGKVVDEETQLPIPYANIYNQTNEKGTISNEEGYFQLAINNYQDTIHISFIGYENKMIQLQSTVTFYNIELKESAQLLNEIVVKPKDDSYLFDLIAACKKSSSNNVHTSKAYFELKTYQDDEQMELVEGYYNTAIEGYDLTDLDLKAGRLALQPYENRFFVSLESSRAITMSKLGQRVGYFPDSPISLPTRKSKKHYYLSLEKKYLDDADSIYVINYQPKKSEEDIFFNGKIWINKTNNQFLKITQQCDHCQQYPFLPLFDSDSIKNVSFNITKTFTASQGEIAFKHTDFTYVIDYKSRVGASNEKSYSIKAEAVLYAYDYGDPFFAPRFSSGNTSASDYRKINAMPYNDFFWAFNDEYSMSNRKRLNESFYAHPNSVTNKELFKPRKDWKQGFFEMPFIKWSNKRVMFRDVVQDTIADLSFANFQEDRFNLAVKIFLDINTYNDSTHILTETVFDPYVSYCYLPDDNKTRCFINTFFDLCEIERRKLQENLKSVSDSYVEMEAVFDHFLVKYEKMKKSYFDEVRRGTNEEAMIKWNAQVLEQLGIDNIELFDPFDRKQE